MEIKYAFGKRLKALREKAGLSQVELSEKLNISRGSISFYENGERTPNIEALKGIADYFNVSANDLLGIQLEQNDESKQEEINRLAADIHDNAIIHGWWDEPCSFAERVALCHSELSEALEEYRDKKPNVYYVADMEQDDGQIIPCVRTDWGDGSFEGEKPEGIAVELADCIIRILDYCAAEGIDIDRMIRLKHEYNKKKPYRHGGKKL